MVPTGQTSSMRQANKLVCPTRARAQTATSPLGHGIVTRAFPPLAFDLDDVADIHVATGRAGIAFQLSTSGICAWMV